MRKRLLPLVGLLLILPTLSFAQETKRISLHDAVEIALENSIELKKARNNLEFAEEQEFSAKANFLPSVNASLNSSRFVGRSLNESTVTFEDQIRNSLNGSINASMPIFEGFSNILSLRNSRANRELEENTLERTRETAIFNAASNYLQVLLDQQLLQIAKENLKASKDQLRQVTAQVEVGSRPTVDLYDQESVVANNELEVIDRENTLEMSKTRLIRILQLDPGVNYIFSMPDLEPVDVSRSDYDLQTLTEEALSNRKDLQSQELNIAILENNLKEARFALYPSITANASLGSGYSDTYVIPNPMEGGWESVSFQDQFFDQQINRSVGLSLRIPIFNNWTQQLNIQQAKVNYKNAQLDLEDQRYAIIEEVRQAYNDYRSYIKRLESSQTALRAAERSYETQQQRYEVGSSTLIELSNANARYTEAQANLATALYNVVFQEKLLDYYLGKLDENISLP